MAGTEEVLWTTLPDHILLNIFSYITLKDRLQAALSCKPFYAIFHTPSLWRKFEFSFFSPVDSCQLKCVELYGEQLRKVSIALNQVEEDNRRNACNVIRHLAECPQRRLEEISINFMRENPFFFQGGEFLNSLGLLFGPPAPNSVMHSHLRVVDLSKLAISLTDLLLSLLADNHPTLEVLNIQNVSLTCHVSPLSMLALVQKCKKLRKLSTFYKSVSGEVFQAFGEEGHVPLEYLSLACRREEKYHKLLSGEAWSTLVASSPKLRVSMSFDHTIERHQIAEILHPEIPITELSMRTMSELHEEVRVVAAFYPRTLEVFVIVTKGSDSLQRELLNLVSAAARLRVLHCYCGLNVDTIERVKALCPLLEDYTLKTADDFDEMQRVFIGRAARNTVMSGR